MILSNKFQDFEAQKVCNYEYLCETAGYFKNKGCETKFFLEKVDTDSVFNSIKIFNINTYLFYQLNI